MAKTICDRTTVARILILPHAGLHPFLTRLLLASAVLSFSTHSHAQLPCDADQADSGMFVLGGGLQSTHARAGQQRQSEGAGLLGLSAFVYRMGCPRKTWAPTHRIRLDLAGGTDTEASAGRLHLDLASGPRLAVADGAWLVLRGGIGFRADAASHYSYSHLELPKIQLGSHLRSGGWSVELAGTGGFQVLQGYDVAGARATPDGPWSFGALTSIMWGNLSLHGEYGRADPGGGRSVQSLDLRLCTSAPPVALCSYALGRWGTGSLPQPPPVGTEGASAASIPDPTVGVLLTGFLIGYGRPID